MKFEGRVWKFGDNIPTDQIVAGHLVLDPLDQIKHHVLENLNPRFAKEVQEGDILVAGKHFGQSSGRAIAVKAIMATGVSCVVAEDLARTFYRNCFEVGLPGVECPGITDWVEDGETLAVDLEAGVLRRGSDGATRDISPMDPLLRRMLEAGGIIAMGEEFDRWEANTASAS